MAFASGCSDSSSAAAMSRTSSRSSTPSATATPTTVGSARVIVPVLSSAMTSSWRAASSASPPRISIPYSAALPVPIAIAVGVAKPSADPLGPARLVVSPVMPSHHAD